MPDLRFSRRHAAMSAVALLCLAMATAVFVMGKAGFAIGSPSAGSPAPQTRDPAFHRAELLRQAGRQIFSDPTYSASGRQSCASCHDPAHRYNPANALDVQPGGSALDSVGFRSPPTLTYLNRIPPYSNHYHDSDDEGDESVDAGPTGGLTWDGRVERGENQARIPLLASFEMANTVGGVARAVRASTSAATLRDALGPEALDRDDGAFAAVVRALAAFEQDYDEFNPYTSRYDGYLTGQPLLSEQELHGLALFEDPAKGNCAACHISQRSLDGTAPALSDYGMIALGVPRNPHVPRNADPAFFDLGVCGPERHDKLGQGEYCGLFRTPTLRNVALRKTFFHNGSFHELRDVVAFYVTRDITPARWYSKNADGSVHAYDDLPAAYQSNLNRDAPFDEQKPGAQPRLDDGEIDDVVAFLQTLTDGALDSNPYRAERSRMMGKAAGK